MLGSRAISRVDIKSSSRLIFMLDSVQQHGHQFSTMKFSSTLAILGLAACSFAAPAPPTHVVHEKREHQLEKWSRRSVKLNRDALIPMSIGLTQRNLDQGYEFLMDVSHPESKNYGKHWSMNKV